MAKMRGRRKPKGKSRTRKLIKLCLVLLGGIGLLLFSLHALVDLFSRDIFALLVKHLEKKSAGLYTIKYDGVDLDFFHQRIEVSGLSIESGPGTAAGRPSGQVRRLPMIKARIPFLKLEGLSIFQLLVRGRLQVDRLVMKGKELTVSRADKLGHLEPVFEWQEAELKLSGVKTKPYFSFAGGEARLEAPAFFSADGFYIIKAQEMMLLHGRSASSLSFQAAEMTPRYSKYRFSREKGFRTNWLSLKMDRLYSTDIDFTELMKNRRFYCRNLTVERPQFDIFRDRRVPKSPQARARKFPQQWLREMKFKLRIDRLAITQGSLVYSEQEINEKKAGMMFFTDFKATVKNVVNFPEVLEEKPSLAMTVSTRAMGKGPLNIKLVMPITDKKNAFTLSGSLGAMDMKAFNVMLVPNVHVRVDRCAIDKIVFRATGDNHAARGKMTFLYQNLKVSLLRPQEAGKHQKRGIPSLLANIIIRSHNPRPGRPLRLGKIYFVREQPLSFFSYIGEMLLTGIKSTIGL